MTESASKNQTIFDWLYLKNITVDSWMTCINAYGVAVLFCANKKKRWLKIPRTWHRKQPGILLLLCSVHDPSMNEFTPPWCRSFTIRIDSIKIYMPAVSSSPMWIHASAYSNHFRRSANEEVKRCCGFVHHSSFVVASNAHVCLSEQFHASVSTMTLHVLHTYLTEYIT